MWLSVWVRTPGLLSHRPGFWPRWHVTNRDVFWLPCWYSNQEYLAEGRRSYISILFVKSCRRGESQSEGKAGRIESLPAPRGSQHLASPPVLSGGGAVKPCARVAWRHCGVLLWWGRVGGVALRSRRDAGERLGVLWRCCWGVVGHCAGPINCAAHGAIYNLQSLFTIQRKRWEENKGGRE